MKTSIQFYLMGMALLFVFAGKAQEVSFPTKGTSTSSQLLPLASSSMQYDQHSQTIYPASKIPQVLKGAQITQIAFNTGSYGSTWGEPVVTVKLMNTEETNLKEDFLDVSSVEVLYEGEYQITEYGLNGRIILNLKKPFVYTGDNLLLDITSTGGSSAGGIVMYDGENSPVDNCARRSLDYVREGVITPTIFVGKFLPVLTVKYIPAIIEEAVTLPFSNMTNNSVTINGRASNITGDLGFKYNVNGGVWQYVIAEKQNMTGYTAMNYRITSGLNVGSTVSYSAWGKGTKDTIWGEQLNVTIKSGCIEPSLTDITGISGTGATVNLLTGSQTSLFNIRYKSKFANDWTYKYHVSNGALTGLKPGTTYEVQAQTVCSSTDSSIWSIPKIFRTSCGATSVPYFEDFTSLYTIEELCYKVEVSIPGANPEFYGIVEVDTASKNLKIDNLAFFANITYHLMLPKFDVDVNLLRLRFRAYSESGTNTVSIGVTSIDNPQLFVPVEDTSFNSTLNLYNFDLSNYKAAINGTERIVIKMITSDATVRIEDIEVTIASGDCQSPYNVTVSNVQLTQAEVDWIPEAGQTDWEIQYRSAVNDNWTNVPWKTVTVKNHPYTLTGLPQNTQHQVRIRTICGEEMSGFSNTIGFRTQGNGIFIPETNIHVYSYLNSVYIVNNNNLRINKVEIYDLYGRLVHQGLVNNNPEIINMNVPAGNYIVRIITPNALKNYKVFIIK